MDGRSAECDGVKSVGAVTQLHSMSVWSRAVHPTESGGVIESSVVLCETTQLPLCVHRVVMVSLELSV